MMRKILFIGAVVLLANACRSDTIQINARFDHLAGLASGDRVLFERNPAGKVESVHYTQDGVYDVRLKVDKGFANALTQYSEFHLIDDRQRAGHKAIEIRLARQGGTPLPDGASVTGIGPPPDLGAGFQKDLEAGFEFFKKQVQRFRRDLQGLPESKEYQRLKKSLADLADEIVRSERKARQKIKEKWLPKIEQELDELRRRLHELGREEELQPLQRQVERIRKI